MSTTAHLDSIEIIANHNHLTGHQLYHVYNFFFEYLLKYGVNSVFMKNIFFIYVIFISFLKMITTTHNLKNLRKEYFFFLRGNLIYTFLFFGQS